MNFRFPPSENVVFHSKLSPDQVKRKILLSTKGARRVAGNDFEGSITGNEFRIYRMIQYKNSWLPQLKGKVEQDETGAKVFVYIGLFKWVVIFHLAMAFFALFILLGVFTTVPINMQNLMFYFTPVIMLSFLYFAPIISFHFESRVAKRRFAALIDGEEVK